MSVVALLDRKRKGNNWFFLPPSAAYRVCRRVSPFLRVQREIYRPVGASLPNQSTRQRLLRDTTVFLISRFGLLRER